MRSVVLLPVLLTLAVGARLVADEKAQGAEDPAIAAARKRQEVIRALRVKYTRKDEIPRGGESGLEGGGNLIPDRDLVFDSAGSVCLDGKKFRYENDRPLFHFPSGELVPGTRISVTNGVLAKTLTRRREGDPRWHSGGITGNPVSKQAQAMEIQPVLWFSRWVDPSLCT